MEELLSAEERNALLGGPGGAGRGGPAMALAVFPSVTQLDPERTYALVSRAAKWMESVAADLGRHLQPSCTARPPHVQMVAQHPLPPSGEACFWGTVEGEEGAYVLLSLPRAFATGACERVFG